MVDCPIIRFGEIIANFIFFPENLSRGQLVHVHLCLDQHYSACITSVTTEFRFDYGVLWPLGDSSWLSSALLPPDELITWMKIVFLLFLWRRRGKEGFWKLLLLVVTKLEARDLLIEVSDVGSWLGLHQWTWLMLCVCQDDVRTETGR